MESMGRPNPRAVSGRGSDWSGGPVSAAKGEEELQRGERFICSLEMGLGFFLFQGKDKTSPQLSYKPLLSNSLSKTNKKTLQNQANGAGVWGLAQDLLLFFFLLHFLLHLQSFLPLPCLVDSQTLEAGKTLCFCRCKAGHDDKEIYLCVGIPAVTQTQFSRLCPSLCLPCTPFLCSFLILK